MKIEKFKGTILVSRPSPVEGGEDEYEEKTGFPIVRFDSHRNPFLWTEMCCSNPDCNCNEFCFSFTEINESGIPEPDRIRFSFYLDLETWQEKRIPERSKVSQRFVDEFVNNLTDEMKTRYKNIYASRKERARKASTFTMPVDEIKKGTLVSYAEVFGDTGSLLYGGGGTGFRLEYKGKKYLIDDLYCMNPRCKCESVRLVFITDDKKKEHLIDLFTGIFSLAGRFELEEENCLCTTKEAIKIFKAWVKSDPGGMDLLKVRYKEMKDIGQRILSEEKSARVKAKIYSKKRKKKSKK